MSMTALILLAGLLLFFFLWLRETYTTDRLRSELWSREKEVARLRWPESTPANPELRDSEVCRRPYKAITSNARAHWGKASR